MWDMDNPNIPSTLEKILNILGQISMTCRYDNSNKPLCETKSQVLLTQSHSSTLCQEIIELLRLLHGLVGWNQVLNSMIIQKLNISASLLMDSNFPSNDEQQNYLMFACLNVIGAQDIRPRIGSVVDVDGKQGTVFRVTQKGKLCVQMHNSLDVKKVVLYDLKLIPQLCFHLDRMPFNENLIKAWAKMLISKCYGQCSTQERKYIYGKYM